jgi:chorismate mutase
MDDYILNLKRKIVNEQIKKLIENNQKLKQFSSLKKFIINCLVKNKAIQITTPLPKPLEIESYSTSSDEESENPFEEYGVPSDVRVYYEQRGQPEEYRPGVRQFEQMSISTPGSTSLRIEGGDEKLSKLSQWQKWFSYKDQAIAEGVSNITDVIESLNLGNSTERIVNMAIKIWKDLINSLDSKQRIKKEWRAWVVLYTLNEIEGKNYLPESIFSLFDVKTNVSNYVKWIETNKNILPSTQIPIENIDWCGLLIDTQEKELLKSAVKTIEEENTIPSPRTNKKALTALVWWFLKNVRGIEKITKASLRKKCKIQIDELVKTYFDKISELIIIFEEE